MRVRSVEYAGETIEHAGESPARVLRQYLNFCASKASKVTILLREPKHSSVTSPLLALANL
jgi:hypothetical protein